MVLLLIVAETIIGGKMKDEVAVTLVIILGVDSVRYVCGGVGVFFLCLSRNSLCIISYLL